MKYICVDVYIYIYAISNKLVARLLKIGYKILTLLIHCLEITNYLISKNFPWSGSISDKLDVDSLKINLVYLMCGCDENICYNRNLSDKYLIY
jgi:hypothetical protein